MAAEPSAAWRWLLLIVLSITLTAALELIGLPAGLLLGPMSAGIILSTRGLGVSVPQRAFVAAQAMVGCLIAASLGPGILHTVAHDWLLFLAVTAATLGASASLGYLLSRWQVLPGTTAIWGSAPGAATAMVLMAEAYGADSRLVAVMTYTRVVAVAAAASLLALILTGHASSHGPASNLLAPVNWVDAGAALAVAVAGVAGGSLLRVPAAGIIGPLVVGAIVNLAGWVHPMPPALMLGLAYAFVGWRIGLNFTRETLAVAGRAMPRILLSIALLIGFCGVLAALLAWLGGYSPVTAYLATSPGGMDSVAIIAASTRVDVPFVMALQAMRFVAVLLAGPRLARFVAERSRGRNINIAGSSGGTESR